MALLALKIPMAASTKSGKMVQTLGFGVCVAAVVVFVAVDRQYSFWWTGGFLLGGLLYGVGRFMVWWKSD
jgi:hypothetical protein